MYVIQDGKKLKRGFTTGATATAALKASLEYSMNNRKCPFVEIGLPGGEKLVIPVEKYIEANGRKYAFVRKDAGDDADITDGCLISVGCDLESGSTDRHGITFDSEYGVGRVTKDGLGIEIGLPAINEIPRKMMCELLMSYGVDSARVIVNVENGEELAKSTLNGRLGIIGGISIIGTTGFVEPMSEESWKESLLPQMDVLRSNGFDELILIPGGVGERLFISKFGIKDNIILCGNHFGFSVKKAAEKGFRHIHISGAFQKIIKLAGGNWNTDSRYSDSKAEILALHAVRWAKKYDGDIIEGILAANPFSTVIRKLDEGGLDVCGIFDGISESITDKLTMLISGCGRPVGFRVTIFFGERILSDYSKAAEN